MIVALSVLVVLMLIRNIRVISRKPETPSEAFRTLVKHIQNPERTR